MKTLESHYIVLGVERGASPDEIRRAWARLVRLHPPDQDPEGNRRINEAKVTLLDPAARENYDALLDFGDEITDLLSEAGEAEEEEDWAAAARAYKEILAYHPNNHAARNRLALCQSYGGDDAASVKTLETLVAKEPGIPVYWSNLGTTLMELSQAPGDVFSNRALAAFERARDLEPHNAAHHISLARYFRWAKRFDLAEQHVEEAVHADGRADIEDLEALLELPWIHLFADQKEKLVADAERIRRLVPPDNQEMLEYCSFRFLKFAHELAEDGLHEIAAAFVKAARKITPNLGELEKWGRGVERAGRIKEQVATLKSDNKVLECVRQLAYICHDGFFDYSDEEECVSGIEEMLEAAQTWSNSELGDSVSRLKQKYPDLYSLHAELFERVASMGSRSFSSPTSPSSYVAGRSPQSSSGSDTTGCWSWLIALVIMFFLSRALGCG